MVVIAAMMIAPEIIVIIILAKMIVRNKMHGTSINRNLIAMVTVNRDHRINGTCENIIGVILLMI